MIGKKLQLASILLVSLFVFTKAFSAISVYEKDTLGADETPVSVDTIPLANQIQSDQIKIYPALHAWGLFGKYNTGKAQILWPFTGNNLDSAFYGVVEGSYANNCGGLLGGIGVGYRKALQDAYILGGYLLADYNRTHNNGNYFYIANPGLELLSETWNGRVNFYFPLSNKKRFYDQYHYEYTGTGFDSEVGNKIPGLFGLKAFVGGYYFRMNQGESNMAGFSGRLEFPIKRFLTLDFRFTSDNIQKNCIVAGARLSLGGPISDDPSALHLNGMIFDPIEHNLSTFAKGFGVPIVDSQL